MARVVCVHEVGQQLHGENTLRTRGGPLWLTGYAEPVPREKVTEPEVAVAFYGDIFRPAGHWLAARYSLYTVADVAERFEQDLIATWWSTAAGSDPGVISPDVDVRMS